MVWKSPKKQQLKGRIETTNAYKYKGLQRYGRMTLRRLALKARYARRGRSGNGNCCFSLFFFSSASAFRFRRRQFRVNFGDAPPLAIPRCPGRPPRSTCARSGIPEFEKSGGLPERHSNRIAEDQRGEQFGIPFFLSPLRSSAVPGKKLILGCLLFLSFPAEIYVYPPFLSVPRVTKKDLILLGTFANLNDIAKAVF